MIHAEKIMIEDIDHRQNIVLIHFFDIFVLDREKTQITHLIVLVFEIYI